jgi:hypothetical protein
MPDEAQVSPVPGKEDNGPLSFPLAIMNVAEGKAITKGDWNDKEYYGKMVDGRLKLHKPDGQFYDWILSDGDIAGVDYYVID